METYDPRKRRRVSMGPLGCSGFSPHRRHTDCDDEGEIGADAEGRHWALHCEAGPSRLSCADMLDGQVLQTLRGGGRPSRRQQARPSLNTADPDLPNHISPSHPPKSGGSHGQSPGKRGKARPLASRTHHLRSSQLGGSLSTSFLSADLEAIALEDRQVRSELSRLSLDLRDVKGDGNCLFRALADQVWGEQGRHREVRELVCDCLEREKEELEGWAGAFYKEGEDWDGYVKRMREGGQYGQQPEIVAAARVFKRDIRIVMAANAITIPHSSSSPSPDNGPELTHDPTPAPEARARLHHSTLHGESNGTTTPSTAAEQPTPDTPTPRHVPRRTRSLRPRPLSPSYPSFLSLFVPPVSPGKTMLWLALFSKAEHYQSIRQRGKWEGGAEVPDEKCMPHELDGSERAKAERVKGYESQPEAGEGADEVEGRSHGKGGRKGRDKPGSGPMSKREARRAQRGGGSGGGGAGGSKAERLLACLPAGHGLTSNDARAALKEVQGNWDLAVEDLLRRVGGGMYDEKERGNAASDEQGQRDREQEDDEEEDGAESDTTDTTEPAPPVYPARTRAKGRRATRDGDEDTPRKQLPNARTEAEVQDSPALHTRQHDHLRHHHPSIPISHRPPPQHEANPSHDHTHDTRANTRTGRHARTFLTQRSGWVGSPISRDDSSDTHSIDADAESEERKAVEGEVDTPATTATGEGDVAGAGEAGAAKEDEGGMVTRSAGRVR